MDPRSFRHFEVSAGSGTPLAAWERSAPAGAPAVLLCPGLGPRPEAHPELLHSAAPARLLGWSPRRTAERWDAHVAEAQAVLDAAEVEACAVLGWSAGSAVAAELARREPERVRGLLLLGPEPGAPLLRAAGVPESAIRALASGAGGSLDLAAPLLDLLGRVEPGEVLPPVLRGLFGHDWRWELRTSLSLIAHPPAGSPRLDCPVTLVTGRHDPLGGAAASSRRVAALPQARTRVVPAAHFVPWEAADVVATELCLLLRRVRGVECARLGLDPPAAPIAHRRIRLRRIPPPRRAFPYPPPGHPGHPFGSAR